MLFMSWLQICTYHKDMRLTSHPQKDREWPDFPKCWTTSLKSPHSENQYSWQKLDVLNCSSSLQCSPEDERPFPLASPSGQTFSCLTLLATRNSIRMAIVFTLLGLCSYWCMYSIVLSSVWYVNFSFYHSWLSTIHTSQMAYCEC